MPIGWVGLLAREPSVGSTPAAFVVRLADGQCGFVISRLMSARTLPSSASDSTGSPASACGGGGGGGGGSTGAAFARPIQLLQPLTRRLTGFVCPSSRPLFFAHQEGWMPQRLPDSLRTAGKPPLAGHVGRCKQVLPSHDQPLLVVCVRELRGLASANWRGL